ncbi:hypothetical protein MD484_g8443, partial [Candolleomyces efflorescens]
MVKLHALLAAVAFVASAANVAASPVEAATTSAPSAPAELRCADDQGSRCPPGYTCCGPIRPGIGGVCRLLGPGQVCIF